jgi:hypothetical protein
MNYSTYIRNISSVPKCPKSKVGVQNLIGVRGEQKYSSTRFDFDFHDPISLYPGKKSRYTLNRRLCGFPRPSGSFTKQKNLCLCWQSNQYPSVVQHLFQTLYPLRYPMLHTITNHISGPLLPAAYCRLY